MGRWHAQALARVGGELLGVADADPDAARRLAARYPPARAFEGFERLLPEVEPDVVHVCTPPDSHAALVEQALLAGAHVLVEKPVASNTPVTQRLIELAQSSGRMLCPVHQYLFQDGFRRAHAHLPRIAPLLHLDFTACSAGGAGSDDAKQDRIIGEILPHPLAVLERLLPSGVEELRWAVTRSCAGELRATACAGTATLSLCLSLAGRPTRNRLRAIGAAGTIHLDFFHGFAVVEGGAVSRGRKILHPFAFAAQTVVTAALNLGSRALRREPAYPGLRALIEQLYGAIREAGSPPISYRETLAVAQARDRLIAALEASRG